MTSISSLNPPRLKPSMNVYRISYIPIVLTCITLLSSWWLFSYRLAHNISYLHWNVKERLKTYCAMMYIKIYLLLHFIIGIAWKIFKSFMTFYITANNPDILWGTSWTKMLLFSESAQSGNKLSLSVWISNTYLFLRLKDEMNFKIKILQFSI